MFKLDDSECIKLWKDNNVEYDDHYKLLAQLNLAIVTFYQNIATQPNNSKDQLLHKLNETMSYFDFTM